MVESTDSGQGHTWAHPEPQPSPPSFSPLSPAPLPQKMMMTLLRPRHLAELASGIGRLGWVPGPEWSAVFIDQVLELGGPLRMSVGDPKVWHLKPAVL